MRAKFVNNLLLEVSLDTINEKDIVNTKFINELLSDSFCEELLIAAYRQEEYIDEKITDEKILRSNDFKKWIKYELETRFHEIQNKFNYEIIDNDDKITIWRKLLVNKNWLRSIEEQNLGIYWSWNKDAAEPHWGYNQTTKKLEVIIESSINEDQIDWIKTLQLNINYSSEEEKEVRLFKDTLLKIDKLWINNKEVDVSFLRNKSFKA
jgi:hypothetical protein